MTTKRPERDDPHRQIVPRPEGAEGEALYAWLVELFVLSPRTEEPGRPKREPDSFPDRIALRACFGPGGRELGPIVFEQSWKPRVQPVPRHETLIELANTIYAKAQHDARQLGRRQVYAALAYSNVKGANAYGRHLLSIFPGAKEYTEAEVGAAGEDSDAGTTTKSLLAELYRDRRFLQENLGRMFEQYQSATEGLLSKYESRLSAQETVATELMKVNLEMIKLREDLLDRKQQRELRVEKEKFWQAQIEEGVGLAKTLLPPIIGYVTRGRHGIEQGVRLFFDGLTPEKKDQLLGVWVDGTCTQPGILNGEQVQLLVGLVEGKVPPSAIADLTSSLSQEQMMAASTVLSGQEIQSLIALSRAAAETSANGANGAS